jgi:hypothetical protein
MVMLQKGARNELTQLLELLKKLEAADNLILCNIPSVRQVEVMKNTIMMMKQPKILLTEKKEVMCIMMMSAKYSE